MPAATIGIRRSRGAAAVTLSSGTLEATFVPELNMLGTSLRLDGEDFLARPGGIAAYRRGHTTGLPMLAPWANRLGELSYRSGRTRVDLSGLPLHTDGRGLPIHGTMSARESWELTELVTRGGVARLRATFDYDRPDLLAAFPFPHRLDVTVDVEDGVLSVSTSLTPTGRIPVPVAFGYHPYLRLPEGRRSRWVLELPRRTHLELDMHGVPTGRRTAVPGERVAIGARTFDDLFELTGERRISLTGRRHTLAVEYGRGYDHAQVFAPPAKGFVCLEPMTAPTNALVAGGCRVVRPGETFTARFRIRVAQR